MLRSLLIALIFPIALHAQHWEKIYPSWNDSDIECFLHWDGDTVYAAGRNFALLRSDDAGVTWKEVNIGTREVDIHSMKKYRDGFLLIPHSRVPDWYVETYELFMYTPLDGTIDDITFVADHITSYRLKNVNVGVAGEWIYVMAANETSFPSGWYRSSDNGATWLAKRHQFTTYANTALYFTDPANGWMTGNPSGQFLFSTTDSGNTWERAFPDKIKGGNQGIHRAGSGQSAIMSVGNTGGIYIRTNDGASWRKAAGIEWGEAEYIDHRFLPDGTGYAFSREGDVFYTPDTGFTWQRVTTGSTHSLDAGRCNAALVLDDGAGGRLVRGWAGGLIDRGTKEAGLEPVRQTQFSQIYRAKFYDENRGIIFGSTWEPMSSRNHVFETIDGGETWTYIHEIQPPRAQYIHMPVPNAWYAVESWEPGGYRVVRSIDYGLTWDTMVEWDAGTPESGYNIFVLDSEHLFVKSKEGTNVSADAGVTWEYYPDNDEDLLDGRDQATSTVRHSFIMKDADSGYIISQRQLYRTTDGCRDWEKVKVGADFSGDILEFHVLSMDDLALNKYAADSVFTREYVMSTDGGSTWNSLESMRNIFEAYLNKLGDGYARSWYNTVYPVQGLEIDSSGRFEYSATGNVGLEFVSSGTGWLYRGCALFRTTAEAVTPVPQAPRASKRDFGISVFPNPVARGGRAVIELREATRDSRLDIRVYDIIGREVGRTDARGRETRFLIWRPDAGLSPGMYIVIVRACYSVASAPVIIVE